MACSSPVSTLLTCEEALSLIAAKMQALHAPAAETVSLGDAHGRVLATELKADRDQPPFPRSARDGYAVRAADLPRQLRLVGAIRAGEQWSGPALKTGEAIEIMTGAPLPEGADAVLMLEHARLDGSLLTPDRTLRSGENFVPQAAEARAGDAPLHRGTRIGAAEIALAASLGAASLAVYTRPRVAILATGDELVDVAETPGPMQIRNSNAHGLAALVAQNGGIASVMPIAKDTRESLAEAITAARGAQSGFQMLLLSGGVSAGRYDFVEEVLLSLGAEFFFTGVKIQPGKPAVFGRLPATGPGTGTATSTGAGDATESPLEHNQSEQWVFGLPGNPVSTQVTATLFAMPLLRALGGETGAAPVFVQAQLAEAIQVRPGLTRFLPARMEGSLHGATVRPTGWQGSGDLHSNARANCYLVVPPDRESLDADEPATILLR